MRPDFRRFANHGDVNMHDPASGGGDTLCGMAQKVYRGAVFIGCIRGRKMRADITIRNRAIKRVGYGVQNKVGIRMPDDAAVMGYWHAAQHDRLGSAFVIEAVHIKPLSGARNRNAWGKIGFMRHFILSGSPATRPIACRPVPQPLRHLSARRCRPMSGQQCHKVEGLRCLRLPQAVARHSFGYEARFGAFQCVGHGNGGNSTMCRAERCQARSISSAFTKGRAASCTRTCLGLWACRASRPASTLLGAPPRRTPVRIVYRVFPDY